MAPSSLRDGSGHKLLATTTRSLSVWSEASSSLEFWVRSTGSSTCAPKLDVTYFVPPTYVPSATPSYRLMVKLSLPLLHSMERANWYFGFGPLPLNISVLAFLSPLRLDHFYDQSFKPEVLSKKMQNFLLQKLLTWEHEPSRLLLPRPSCPLDGFIETLVAHDFDSNFW